MQVRKAQDTDGFSQRRTGLQASGRGGSFAVESVAAFPWNGWQACPGIGGSFGMESVATFVWNRRQLCRGISGRFGVEYAEGDASAKNFSNSSGKPKGNRDEDYGEDTL